MAILRIQKSDNIIFQLLQKNLDATDTVSQQWKEIKVFPMTVKPANLIYSEASRTAITQTTPEEGFIDKYGSQLMQVRMSGTFGLQPRRQGILVKDGYTRLIEFRDEVYRASNRVRQFEGERNIQFLREQKNGNYIYAINYYDFINDEQHCINFTSFVRTLNAIRNPFETTYDLNFTTLGKPIQVTSKDPLLFLLTNISNFTDNATEVLDNAIGILTPAIDVLNFAQEGYDLAVAASSNITTLLVQLGGAIAGQVSSVNTTLSTTATTVEEKWAQIKG
jgi:hypothetical protein